MHNLPEADQILGSVTYRENEDALERLRTHHPVVAITGTEGIGKTWLATELGYACCDEITMQFEAVAWISATGRPDRKLWLDEVLREVNRVINYPDMLDMSSDQKRKIVNERLMEQRTLVIIDNFDTISDPQLIDWLLHLPRPSVALITVRTLRGKFVPRTQRIKLDSLQDSQLFGLLRIYAQRLGVKTIAMAADDELLPLLNVTKRNPKTITLVVGDFANDPSVNSISDYVGRSHDQPDWKRRLEQLGDQASKLLAASAFFDDTFSHEAVGAVAGISAEEVAEAMYVLTTMQLFEPIPGNASAGRYRIHTSVRDLAHERLQLDPQFRAQAEDNWQSYYLGYLERHVRRENQERYWDTLGAGGLTPVDPEWRNLRKAMEWAFQNKADERFIEFMMLLVHYMDRRGYYEERLAYANMALAACDRLLQSSASERDIFKEIVLDKARFLIDTMGWTQIEYNLAESAQQHIEQGLALIQQLPIDSDLVVVGWQAVGYAFLARATMYFEPENEDEISRLIAEAKSFECSPLAKVRVHWVAGEWAEQRDQFEVALREYQAALHLTEKYGDVTQDADETLIRMASVLLTQERYAEAQALFDAPTRLYQETGTIEAIRMKFGFAQVLYWKPGGEQETACQWAREAYDELHAINPRHRALNDISEFVEHHCTLDALLA